MPWPARTARGLGRAEEGGDVLGRLAGQLRQDAGVSVAGNGDRRQAEGLLDNFHVVPGGQQQGRGAVAQVVEADRREPGEVADQVKA